MLSFPRVHTKMGGKSPSSALIYMNSLLCSLSIKPFPSHFLLLAAANDPSATSAVLSSLTDLVVFHLALPPLPNTHTPLSQSRPKDLYSNGRIDPDCHARDEKIAHHKTHSRGITSGPLSMDHLDPKPNANISQEEKLCFVKFYLAMWGYAPSSPIFTLNHGTNESRHLLLAMAWLISHCNIFSRALEKRFSLFMGTTPVITNTYLDTSAVDRGRATMIEAKHYVAKVLAASNSLGDSRAKVKAKGEQLLMLCGRLRMTLRSLYAMLSCKAKRSHELNQMQLADNVRGPEGHPFSPFELHLLEHHKTLEKHLVTLEMARCMIKELDECNQHERKFWRWMGEVAAEARQQQQLQNKHNFTLDLQLSTTSSGVCTANLLPILTYFRTELNRQCSAKGPGHHLPTTPESDGSSNDTIASRVDLISAPVMTIIWKEIQGRETRATSMSCFGTNDQTIALFSSLQRHLLPREATCKSQCTQCLDEKHFKSAKDIATKLVSTLAKIRMKNRTIIQEAMSASMANKNHFFAGL